MIPRYRINERIVIGNFSVNDNGIFKQNYCNLRDLNVVIVLEVNIRSVICIREIRDIDKLSYIFTDDVHIFYYNQTPTYISDDKSESGLADYEFICRYPNSSYHFVDLNKCIEYLNNQIVIADDDVSKNIMRNNAFKIVSRM